MLFSHYVHKEGLDKGPEACVPEDRLCVQWDLVLMFVHFSPKCNKRALLLPYFLLYFFFVVVVYHHQIWLLLLLPVVFSVFFTSKVCLFVRQCASVFSEPYLVGHHQIWFFFRRCVLLLCFLSYLSSSLESLLSVLVLILCYFSDSLFIR